MAYENYGDAGPSNPNDIAYDPDQDPDERRAVRKRYRDLKAEIEGVSPKAT